MNEPTDTPQPSPDTASEPRRIVFGIVLTVILFLLVTAIFTLIIVRSGGTENSYYNNLMQRGRYGETR